MQLFNPNTLRQFLVGHPVALLLLITLAISLSGCQSAGVPETAGSSTYWNNTADYRSSQTPSSSKKNETTGLTAAENSSGSAALQASTPQTLSPQAGLQNRDTQVGSLPVKVHLSDDTSSKQLLPVAVDPKLEPLVNSQAPGSDHHYRQTRPVSGKLFAGTSTDVHSQQTSTAVTHHSDKTDSPRLSELSDSHIQPVSWLAPAQNTSPANRNPNGNHPITTAQGPAPVVDEVTGQLDPVNIVEDPINTVPLDIELNETTTGRFMFGVGVNSDAGLTGQIMVNERNFNYRDVPFSLRDLTNGRDFRDGGQGLRIEAMPGNLVQRYMFMFTDPYFIPDPSMSGHDISLNISGFYYDRRYYDWAEQRLGGRAAMGYRITDDLSLALALRGEKVTIHNPRVVGVPQLDNTLGDNNLYSGQLTLSHDTRDIPFLPTEGHYIQLGLAQVFGSFSYPQANIDLRRHFLLKERADGSGRQTLSVIMQSKFSGSDTPIYERYFAGGFSTIRGFDFRGASPVNGGVVVGGNFQFITSIEYLFSLTADDMVRGVAFCDMGTVEEEIAMYSSSFRVSPGVGLRISVPMLGPAPLALDFAVPITHAPTDEIQHFSFFLGLGRG